MLLEKQLLTDNNCFFQGEGFMICYRYLFCLIISFVFLANSALALGPYQDNGETILDQTTGLEWQKNDSSNYTNLTWANALAYCEDMVLAEYDDWRLPNKLELRSIVEHSKIDPPAIDNLFSCKSSWYWSSTSSPYPIDEFSGGKAWLIDFNNGEDERVEKDLDLFGYEDDINVYVRCVRTKLRSISILFFMPAILADPEKLPDTGQTKCYDNFGEINCPEDENASFFGQDAHYSGSHPSYWKNDTNTVTDFNTNLIWQQNTADLDHNGLINNTDTRNWQDAVSYCAGLTFADNSNWRLPTKNELQSIIDYGISEPENAQPTINATFSSQSSGYWSATSFVGNSGFAWMIDFENGHDQRDEKTNKYYIRCVIAN